MVSSRSLATVASCALVFAACSSDGADVVDTSQPFEPGEPSLLLAIPGAAPGDIVGVEADDERRIVSWLDRRAGTIHELSIDAPDAEPEVIRTIAISNESQQGGLLDQALLDDGTRVIAYTDADNQLLVATLPDDGDPVVLWDVAPAGNGAIGGKVDALDREPGTVLFSIGRNLDWSLDGVDLAIEVDSSDEMTPIIEADGALLTVPADGSALPTLVSFGYTNPWAFEAVGDDEIWVWDNAAGSEPENPDAEDVERLGRADARDRTRLVRSEVPDRAPTAMITLPDGRLGICGFLDNEMRAYEITDGPDGDRTALERAGTIMPCLTDATIFDDGTIVTAAQTPDGETLQILRP